MTKRGIRVMLWLVIVIAVAVTGYLFWIDETRLARDISAAREFDESTLAAARAVLDIRARQRAYVATDQNVEFWGSEVKASLSAARQALAAMRASSSPTTHRALQSAETALQDFEQMDRRLREYVGSGQLLMASDVIFSDGHEMTEAVLQDIQRARLAEAQDQEAAVRAGRQRQHITLAAGGLALCLVALALVPVPRPKIIEVGSASAPRDTLDLRLTPQEDLGERHSEPVPGPGADVAQPVQRPIDATAVARLCTELARVTDTRALPGILDRAADVLDAAGIVLWIADPDGRELAPILTHGYSTQLVTRLGTIPRDAENVTAAAFRTGLAQIVKADAVSNGAIAAPLMAPMGCVGVMAAEMRHGGEQQESRLAAATIVAAQLATLVGPPVARGNKAEVAG